MINHRDIDYIIHAAKSGSFANAARACNISQPSLSIQIKKVEERLGNRLFIRSKKGVQLTPFGESILPHLMLIQEQFLQIETISQNALNQPKPRLKIGVIHTVAPYLLPRIKNEAKIKFSESSTHELIKQLLNNKIDAAILALPIQLVQLQALKLYREPFHLVSAKHNPYINEMNLETMEPPKGCQFLTLSEEHCLGQQMIELCNLKQHQHDMSDSFRATSLETIRHMVADSDNLTLMPALAQRQSDGLHYRQLPNRFYREIGLVFNTNASQLNDIHGFADEVKALASGIKQLNF